MSFLRSTAVRAILVSLVGAVVSVLAFPPFGPGWLIVVGIALFLGSLRMAGSRNEGLLLGSLYGLSFFGGLMWWLIELELIALILVPVQAAFIALYGWWLSGYRERPAGPWLAMATGGWAFMELIRYFLPVGGLEWGAVGYALSDQGWMRLGAQLIGTSGWTVTVVALSAALVLVVRREFKPWMTAVLVFPTVVVAGAWLPQQLGELDLGAPETVAIVQGSTPCPFEKCPPNERLRTYEQHLELTREIPPGKVDLVVWSEGSTGSTNADPVLNEEIGEAIGAEARRIGAWFLVGGDRILDEEEWVNANVVFDPDGAIVGEYRKQHPVPFGEYVPLRTVFGVIPATDRVPRDMIRGEGPVVFDMGAFDLGSVISFEGGFSRYAREHVEVGAEVIVVATNEGSYGMAPTSDQFIGMTRMRAAENQVPLIHAAVTGKSTVIGFDGDITSEVSGLGTEEIIYGELTPRRARTLYNRTGNLVMWLAAIGAVLLWWRDRALVGSVSDVSEEE